MNRTDVIIIGGGQAGLAMSRELSLRSIDHVVLERGKAGERWRSERWDSLRLLSIAEQSFLPGLRHEGIDSEHFLHAHDFANYLDRYARLFSVPLISMSAVISVRAVQGVFDVQTTQAPWRARVVIIATGACDKAYKPAVAANLPDEIEQVLPVDYRSPAGVRDGGVLVVGTSSTGLQIAEELQVSGRQVTLAVGEHTRMLRRYRNRDIYSWLGDAGVLDDPADKCANLEAARRTPSTQLIGSPDHRELNLAEAMARGIRIMGRLAAIDGHDVHFDGDLCVTTTRAHERLIKTLQRVDAHIDSNNVSASESEIGNVRSIIMNSVPETLNLAREGITSVVWATGYRRDYSWLHVPVVNAHGEVIHDGGITPLPGLYIVGLSFLRRRRSAFIDGCAIDAAEIANVMQTWFDRSGKSHRSLALELSDVRATAKVITGGASLAT
jgi:putative flavoprotein involved in K+ transport